MFLLKGKSVFSKLFLFSLVLVLVFFGLVWPGVSYASDTWEFLANILATPVYWLATLGGELLNLVIYFFVIVAQYNDIITADPVQKGWVIVRDLCNMFFVIVLLVIAFGTVLKIETYHYKRLLPKFLLMAILINFSKTIAGLFIDAAQIIMLTFVAGFVSITGGNLIDALKVSKYLTFKPDTGAFQGAATIFVSAVLALIAIIIALIVVVIMAVILVFRIVALWILVILSPLAYLLSIVPAGQKYSSQWWQQFTKYLIVGPIMAFFLWLSLTTASTVSKQIVSTTGKVIPGEAPTGQIATGLGSWDVLGSYIIGICLLVGSLVAAQQIGVAGGKMAGDWAGRIQRGQVFPAPVKWAGRRLDVARMETGKWLQKKGEGKDTGLGLLARGTGKVMMPQVSMRPTVWKKALQAREARWERKHYAEPTGTAQNIINRLTLSKDRRIDYRAIRRGTEESIEMGELKKAVPYDTDTNRKMFHDTVGKDTLMSKLALTRAVEIADINEIILHPKTQDLLEADFRKKPERYNKRFGINNITQLGYDTPATRQALASLSTGSEEEAVEMAARMGFLESANGNFHLTALVKMDEDTGKMRFATPKEQGVISASLALLEGADKIAGKMKSVWTYEGVEVDKKTGRRKGTYKYEDEKTKERKEGIVLRNEKGQWESIDESGKIIAESKVSFKRSLSSELSNFASEVIPQLPFEALEDQVNKMKTQGMEGTLKAEEVLKKAAEQMAKEGKMPYSQLHSMESFIERVKTKRYGKETQPTEIKFPEGVEPVTAIPIVTDMRKLGSEISSTGDFNGDLLTSLDTQLRQFEKNIVDKVGGETKRVLQTIVERIRASGRRTTASNWEELKEEIGGNIDDLIKTLSQPSSEGGKEEKGGGGQGKETKKGKGLTGENLEFWKKRPGKET